MTINWFDESFKIPLGFGITITIIILLLAIIVPIIVTALTSAKIVWGCPECGKRFKLKWYKRFWIHYSDNAVVPATCPFCHKRVVCTQSFDQHSECDRL